MSEIEKPTIIVDNYGSKNPPAAADFRRGATSIEQIREATAARRDLASNPTPRRDT